MLNVKRQADEHSLLSRGKRVLTVSRESGTHYPLTVEISQHTHTHTHTCAHTQISGQFLYSFLLSMLVYGGAQTKGQCPSAGSVPDVVFSNLIFIGNAIAVPSKH